MMMEPETGRTLIFFTGNRKNRKSRGFPQRRRTDSGHDAGTFQVPSENARIPLRLVIIPFLGYIFMINFLS